MNRFNIFLWFWYACNFRIILKYHNNHKSINEGLLLKSWTNFYGWSRWPSMELDVLDVYLCIVPWCTKTLLWMLKMTLSTAGCLSMLMMSFDAAGCLGCLSKLIMMTPDAAGCLDAQIVTRCTKGFIWMLKMTLIAAGCLGCLSILKLSLDAPKHFYWCSRWPLI